MHNDKVLLTQVIGDKKITRLCNLLLKTNNLSVCVDNSANVEMINSIMKKVCMIINCIEYNKKIIIIILNTQRNTQKN